MRRYSGRRDGDRTIVTVEDCDDAGSLPGTKRDLPLRLELANHSPDGFEWGYGGSGPAQLALAIVCDVLGVPEGTREPRMFDQLADRRVHRAIDVYQAFKDAHVAKWSGDGWWILDEDVLRCIERVEGERAARERDQAEWAGARSDEERGS